jgi:hypothetical protein
MDSGAMVLQAAGFACLAAISPTALIVMAVFLGSANPRLTAMAYVAGAIIMTVVMSVMVLYILRTTGLNQPRERIPRYEFRLALGIVALAGAAFVARRKKPPPDPSKARQGGLMYKLVSHPSPRTAFGAGVLLFAPGATFIAAVQVVATAEAGIPVTALALIIIVLLTCLVVWLPLLTFLVAPEATTRLLKTINDWTRAHTKAIAVYALAITGAALVINGALGLAQVI